LDIRASCFGVRIVPIKAKHSFLSARLSEELVTTWKTKSTRQTDFNC
jgi:hypothetical protein